MQATRTTIMWQRDRSTVLLSLCVLALLLAFDRGAGTGAAPPSLLVV
jgi:hypothetical protein